MPSRRYGARHPSVIMYKRFCPSAFSSRLHTAPTMMSLKYAVIRTYHTSTMLQSVCIQTNAALTELYRNSVLVPNHRVCWNPAVLPNQVPILVNSWRIRIGIHHTLVYIKCLLPFQAKVVTGTIPDTSCH